MNEVRGIDSPFSVSCVLDEVMNGARSYSKLLRDLLMLKPDAK